MNAREKLALLAEKIAEADAVVVGGGSGLSSAAGNDHYHWSPALAEHWLRFASTMDSLRRWLVSIIVIRATASNGAITVNTCASCGKRRPVSRTKIWRRSFAKSLALS